MTLTDLLRECETSIALHESYIATKAAYAEAPVRNEHCRTHAPLASRAVIELARRLRVAEEALTALNEWAQSGDGKHGPQNQSVIDKIARHADSAIETLQAPLICVDAAFARSLERELATALRERDEEKAIVNRIWDILGSPTYKALKGRTIYDLIESVIQERDESWEHRDAALAEVSRLRAALEEISGHLYAFNPPVDPEPANYTHSE